MTLKFSRKHLGLTILASCGLLSACNSGSGGGGSSAWGETLTTLPPISSGPAWNNLGCIGLYDYNSPNMIFTANDSRLVYDSQNDILYAQPINVNLQPVEYVPPITTLMSEYKSSNESYTTYNTGYHACDIITQTTPTVWVANNSFNQAISAHGLTIASYMASDESGNIYAFATNSSKALQIIIFNDNTQQLQISPITGNYPSTTSFANLYYYNNSIYAIADEVTGTTNNYSLIQFSTQTGAYIQTLSNVYSSSNSFMNINTLPANVFVPAQDFLMPQYIAAAIGDGVFYLTDNGQITAIPLENPLNKRVVGQAMLGALKFYDDGFQYVTPAIAYANKKLYTCGLTQLNHIDQANFTQTFNSEAILSIPSNANSIESWSPIGYTTAYYNPHSDQVDEYTSCTNLAAQGRKIFANGISGHDMSSGWVFESSI